MHTSQRLPIETKILVFLYVIGQGTTQRMAAYFFRLSQQSVSNIMAEALEGFSCLFDAFVTLPEPEFVCPETSKSASTRPFHGCIGAIDGTHIKAFVPLAEQRRYYDRKGNISQNVLCAVRLDGTFSYVLAGTEGSVNNASLLQVALQKSFKIPSRRFYVVDTGFGSEAGVLVPFVGVRYHLQEWKKGKNAPQNAYELFNLRHSSLRIIVEQVFGLLKRKFRILRSAVPEYSEDVQRALVYATAGLWNFIKMIEKEEIELDEDKETRQEREDLLKEIRDFTNTNVNATNSRALRLKIAESEWQEYSALRLARAAAGLLESDSSNSNDSEHLNDGDDEEFVDNDDNNDDEEEE
ncbi:hypothetical protein PWT90_10388 [Aphanocladium album]|nr:hypothetical protein PWT90_10388 [Aphanocladium album]